MFGPAKSGPTGAAVARVCALPLTFVAALVLATMLGDVALPANEIVRILLHAAGVYGGAGISAQDQAIVLAIRLPRVITAALVGACLSVAGALFQAVLRNPLADPYVIGTSAGAGFGVGVALLLPVQIEIFGFGAIQLFAFAGALITVFFVYGLARSRGRTPVVTLLLAGFVVSSFLISATSLVMQLGGRLDQVTRWTLGSVYALTGQQLAGIGAVIALSFCGAYLLSTQLDVLALGEDHAFHLGVHVEQIKVAAIVLAALLTGLSVSMAGVIAFVGLVVPHTMRLLYGPRHGTLLISSAIGGAIFLMLCDLVARVAIAPTTLSLGIVTAVLGAPLFLHLLRRSKREYVL